MSRQQAMQRVLRAASDVARHWRPGLDSEGEGIIAELLSGLRDLEDIEPDVVVTSDAHVVTCRCCNEALSADADFDSLAARGQYMVLTLTCPHETETSIRYVLASQPDTYRQPRCRLRGPAKAGDVPQYGCSCPACEYREAQRAENAVYRKLAFVAGAGYVKRETRSLAAVIMPDAERIDAAAAGYVEGLGR